MRRLRKEMAVAVMILCLAVGLTGCGGNNNGKTVNETTGVTENVNGNTTKGNGTVKDGADNTGNTSNMDNNTVNDNTTYNDTNDNRTNTAGNRESGLSEVGEGIGEVGDGIINGAENIVDDMTGNNPNDNRDGGTVNDGTTNNR